MIQIKRVYDAPDHADGTRVLVDRLWPRGLTKEAAALDEWLKDVAPSNDLRKWYGHEPSRNAEFTRRYRAELAHPPAAGALAHLGELAAGGTLTLLTATKSLGLSHADVLRDELS